MRQVLQSVTGCFYKVRQVLQNAAVIAKWDVTSVNILHFEIIHFGKSFVYIRNNGGPKTKSYGTSANISFHEDV